MTKLKKILFPFYKTDQYHFLKEQWWFRLLIVIFIIFVVTTPFFVFFANHSASSDWCWQNVQEKIREGYNDSAFREHSDYCVLVTQSAAWESLIVSITTFLFSLYGLQFIFFKIVIDYIVLGGKNKKIT